MKGCFKMVNKRKFIPEGVEDVNAVEYEKKEWVQTKAKEIFRSFGYHQILTPTFEYYDLFSEIESAINLDEMYKLIDRNGKILVLRPDATIPVARMAATKYGAMDGSLKFMYFTSVYRSADFRAGGKREFTQAGIEYFGNVEPDADAEVIATAIKSLENLNFTNIHIDIGQAEYFKGLMSELDISEQDKNKIRVLIENKNLADLNNIVDTLPITEACKKLLTRMPFLYGEIDEVIEKAKTLAINDTMKKALDNLCDIYEIIKDYGYQDYVFADLGLINHLDYYSGMIFKGYVNNFGSPVLSGGRYDDLLRQFGKEIAATGFGMNIDQILQAASQCNILTSYKTEKDYLILYGQDQRKSAVDKSNALRNEGFVVEMQKTQMPMDEIKQKYQDADYRKVMVFTSNSIETIKE